VITLPRNLCDSAHQIRCPNLAPESGGRDTCRSSSQYDEGGEAHQTLYLQRKPTPSRCRVPCASRVSSATPSSLEQPSRNSLDLVKNPRCSQMGRHLSSGSVRALSNSDACHMRKAMATQETRTDQTPSGIRPHTLFGRLYTRNHIQIPVPVSDKICTQINGIICAAPSRSAGPRPRSRYRGFSTHQVAYPLWRIRARTTLAILRTCRVGLRAFRLRGAGSDTLNSDACSDDNDLADFLK